PNNGGVPIAIPYESASVSDVYITDHGKTAHLIHQAQTDWEPGEQTSTESAALMFKSEETLLPLGAYRVLEGVDPNDPQFGLADAKISITIKNTDGNQQTVQVGNQSFNKGGFYAKQMTQPDRVYLLPRATVADMISLAQGRQFSFPSPIDDAIRTYEKE